MSSEARVVRPYKGVGRVQHLLDQVQLEFGTRVLDPGARVSVPKNEFLAEQPRLRIAADDESRDAFAADLTAAVKGCDLEPDDVEVLVLMSSPRLKIAEIVWRLEVSQLRTAAPRQRLLAEGTRPDALRAPFGGCDIQLFAALNRSLPKQPLRAHRPGTWLGTARWAVRTDLGEIGFVPRELTDEVREQYQLHEDTIRFAKAENVLDSELADDAVEVYVDPEILAQLAVHPTTKGSRILQHQIFMDAMAEVVHSANRELREHGETITYEEAAESLAGRLVTRMATRNGTVDGTVAQQYWHGLWTDPGWVIAHVEGWAPGLRKTFVAGLGEDDR